MVQQRPHHVQQQQNQRWIKCEHVIKPEVLNPDSDLIRPHILISILSHDAGLTQKVILTLLHFNLMTSLKVTGLALSTSQCVKRCVYLCLVSQPRQPVRQQGTESDPALVQLLRRLGDVIGTTPL